MAHRNVRGRIVYLHQAESPPVERGREWFSYTFHEDGNLTVRSQCEIDKGIVEDRTVLRDVVYTVDRDFKPVDGYVRLQLDGAYLGSGWFRVTDEAKAPTAT